MKKLFATFTALAVLFTVFAGGVRPVVNFKPAFEFDSTPAAGASGSDGIGWPNATGPQNSGWYMTKQDYWLEAFSRPGILDLGLEAFTDQFNIVFIMDFRQDTLQYFKEGNKGNYTNIPFLSHTIELNFPRLGYVDYTSKNGNFYLSAGRRQLKWGPAAYSMAISDAQPYLDNIYADINVPMKKGWKFRYNFTGIAYKYFLNYSYNLPGGPKSTFAHKLGFENGSIRIYFSELNNVYGKTPSLLDFTPLGVWHDNYQDNYSNVMLDFSVEGKIGPVRLFGVYTMDDFDLPHESSGSLKFNSAKPAAIGVTAGVEVNLLDGKEINSSKFNYQDYLLAEDTFKVNKGLNIGYEFYYCSKFMYNRDVQAGKFTSPFQVYSFGADYCYDDNAFYLGFKYGPDTMLHRLYAEYTNDPLEAHFSAQFMQRGSYTIDTTYSQDYFNEHLETPFDLSAPVTNVLMLEAGCSYYLQRAFRVSAALSFTRDFTHGTSAVKAGVGASISICEVDWAHLFRK